MTPIFDSNSELVAWSDGIHLFDIAMNWVAFEANGHIFSSKTGEWLGPIHNGSILDTKGKPVAWFSGSEPSGTLPSLKPLKPPKPLKPLRPLLPLKPLKPLQPLVPLGGWSPLGFAEWMSA